MFRQITMDELKDLALDAYGQIEKGYNVDRYRDLNRL